MIDDDVSDCLFPLYSWALLGTSVFFFFERSHSLPMTILQSKIEKFTRVMNILCIFQGPPPPRKMNLIQRFEMKENITIITSRNKFNHKR